MPEASSVGLRNAVRRLPGIPQRSSHPAVVGATRSRREILGLIAVLIAATVLYSWRLDQQGWANSYYAAAAQSGASGWKAFFFGSVDPGNALTTDKPPLSIWVMSASVRLFGLSSVSVLLPQVLIALASVAALHRTVRRHAGPIAALAAAVVLAVTPVFTLLARYDDPDMLLTLLVLLAAYATTRSWQDGSRWWTGVAGVLLGFAFLTKLSVAVLVLPALIASVLFAAPGSLRRRSGALAAMAAGFVVAGGWWFAAVAATPPGSRPFVDGSRGNSLAGLVFGRDGFGRLVGPLSSPTTSTSQGHPPTVNTTIAGHPGPARMFSDQFAGQIGWLLPLALVVLVVGARILLRGRGPREAGYVLWGGWLLTVGGAFSVMRGPIHPYYSVLLAPAIAALVGVGAGEVWGARQRLGQRWAAVSVAALTFLAAGWAAYLLRHLHRSSAPLAAVIVTAGALGAVLVVLAPHRNRPELLSRLAAGCAAVALLAAPVYFCIATVRHPVTGADPVAGPAPYRRAPHVPPALAQFVRAHHGGETWAAAVPTATAAATLQLDSQVPVLTLGGFTGNVASPSLPHVQTWVAQGRLHYLVLAGPYQANAAGITPHTPERLQHTELDRIVTWARATGTPVHRPGEQVLIYRLEPPDR